MADTCTSQRGDARIGSVERCPYRPYLAYFCAGPDTDLGFFPEESPADRFGLGPD